MASSLLLMLTHLQKISEILPFYGKTKAWTLLHPRKKIPVLNGNLINPLKETEGESHRRLLHCEYYYTQISRFVKHFLQIFPSV